MTAYDKAVACIAIKQGVDRTAKELWWMSEATITKLKNQFEPTYRAATKLLN